MVGSKEPKCIGLVMNDGSRGLTGEPGGSEAAIQSRNTGAGVKGKMYRAIELLAVEDKEGGLRHIFWR